MCSLFFFPHTANNVVILTDSFSRRNSDRVSGNTLLHFSMSLFVIYPTNNSECYCSIMRERGICIYMSIYNKQLQNRVYNNISNHQQIIYIK